MKRLLAPLFLFLMIFSLSSCGDNGDITFKDPLPSDDVVDNTGNTTDGGEDTDTSTTDGLTPDYKAPNASITDSDLASPSTAVEQTVEMVYDSVVSINVTATTFTGSGSGVLFSSDEALGLSYIITCFHVIEDCNSISVKLTNGDVYDASLVGGYSDEDLAVLSIEATDLTYASFYTNSDELKLGSQVVCIGNPLGTLPGSVSSGYLSYVNREIAVDSYNTMTLLQTDVAINSGNSGGGLFNTSGNLIGIVNAKYADEDIEGLGFAIPINTVKKVITKFMDTAKYDVANKVWQEGYVAGDWEFGFTISDGYTSNGFMGPVTYVIYISNIYGNETASGVDVLQLNDIITAAKIDYKDESKTDIETLSISSASSLLTEIYSADLSLGDSIIFTVTRNNASQTVTVVLDQYIYSM